MKDTIVIVSGYFNPLHKGHIEYFNLAKSYGDKLLVIVNNDIQRELKGSEEFMLEKERSLIISELKVVDNVFLSIDTDRSVEQTLIKIHTIYSKKYNLIFANGGDQSNTDVPELNQCKKLGIKMIDNIGEKIQSSSWLLGKK